MNPNQIFARPVVEPWKPVTLPDILGDLFFLGGCSYCRSQRRCSR